MSECKEYEVLTQDNMKFLDDIVIQKLDRQTKQNYKMIENKIMLFLKDHFNISIEEHKGNVHISLVDELGLYIFNVSSQGEDIYYNLAINKQGLLVRLLRS